MKQPLTVSELRKALEGIDDDMIVCIQPRGEHLAFEVRTVVKYDGSADSMIVLMQAEHPESKKDEVLR